MRLRRLTKQTKTLFNVTVTKEVTVRDEMLVTIRIPAGKVMEVTNSALCANGRHVKVKYSSDFPVWLSPDSYVKQ